MAKSFYKRRFLAGVAMISLSVSAPAFAQSATQDANRAAGADSNGIADIVVTAQRREERNQDVPIVITAFTPEAIQKNNISSAQDLNGLIPSMTIGTKGNGSREIASPTIRGQGATFQAAPGVVMYLNEVPLPAAYTLSVQGGHGNFVDLENMQVLSGPQGTLFGRNTTGGAVLLSPKKPTNNLEGYVEGSLGNYSLRSIEGAINVPLVDDKLMVRVTGAYRDRDGFTRDIVWNKNRDDTHWYMGRIGVLMKPVEGLTNYLLAYGSRSSTNGSGILNQSFNLAGLEYMGFCNAAYAVPCSFYQDQTDLQQEIGIRKVRHGVDGFQKVRTWGLINTTDLEVTSELTLRNIVSYQKFWGDYSYDGDGTPIQQYDSNGFTYPDFTVAGFENTTWQNFSVDYPRDDLKQITEELQLQGNVLDGKMHFAVGGFYYDLKPDGLWGTRQLNFCPAAYTGYCVPGYQFAGVTNKSKALYAQTTVDLGLLTPSLERLKLTAGYRYTWDDISGFTSSWYFDNAGAVCSFTGENYGFTNTVDQLYDACMFAGRRKTKAPTWTLGLDYQPIDNLLLYAKASRGYKAGGYNPFAVREEAATFLPEKLTSYEAGFKFDTRLGDVPARLNATYYYSDYKDIQQSAGDARGSASGAQFVQRDGTIQGVEVEAMAKPTSWLQLGGTLSYTDGKYKDSDFAFQYVVPWLYNVNATVDLPIPENLGSLSFYANYSHQSAQPTDALQPASQPGHILEGYGLLNLSLNWKNVAQSNFDVGLFMTNTANKDYRIMNTNVFTSLLVNGQMYGEPRMYGVKLRYSFGQ